MSVYPHSSAEPQPRNKNKWITTDHRVESRMTIRRRVAETMILRSLPEHPLSIVAKSEPPPSQIPQLLRTISQQGVPVLELLQLNGDYAAAASVTATTLRQYASGLNSYMNFVDVISEITWHEVPYFPPSSQLLTAWLSTFRNANTAANYLSHVRKWAILLREEVGDLYSPLTTAALKGQSKICPGGTRKMKPISLAMLKQIINTNPHSVSVLRGESDEILNAMVVLAYWFLLRIPSELLNLTAYQLKIRSDKSALIHLHKRKNMPSGSVLVRFCVCASVGERLCPHFWASYLLSRINQSGTDEVLFPGLTAAEARSRLRKRLSHSGISDPERYGLHSLRRGHATDLARLQTPPAVILRMGQWRSAAFKLYLDLPEINAQAAASLVISESSDEED